MKEDREFVTSLARGLSVIQAFDRDNAELTLTEIANRTRLSPATARRFLWTLQKLGYVGANGRVFFLQPKVVSLGSAFLASARVDEIIQPILREIVEHAGTSASLAVADGDNVLIVANFSLKRMTRLTAGAGTRYPIHISSMGRVILADLPDQQLDKIVRQTTFKAFTKWTVTDADELWKRLREVRRDGFCVTQDELEEGLDAVAVPVRIGGGRAIAALNCTAYSRQQDKRKLVKSGLQPLLNAAEKVKEAVQQFPTLAHIFAQPTP
ncbi:IclR family transcriptional regulator domain-containing protein [Pseudorhodoplanes sp.]|uniref:IclR family transcriptional regulator domain-containing protein n=1 Tax=Pseudorhodoplanes sp. TaxID=1934341 RepID=UPI003D150F4D